ncbi:hypothetical protein [Aestuariivivens sp. NBU2969]|uniref:hypothetical protein n=1 Tax=Aestuariivivens sp. NBU2969 TaxID=2873267 RepID=UPI001CBE01DA|nr:hypothetical protein [Aestuariivivens sp. NBU2969]
MKNLFFVSVVLFAFLSCKNEARSKEADKDVVTDGPERTAKQSDGLTLLKGDFVYFDGAAVLQTHANIYGVFVTDKMHELNKLVQPYKKVPTDMIPVEIRGKITDKEDDVILWEQKVEIKEILNVFEPKKENNDVIELGS